MCIKGKCTQKRKEIMGLAASQARLLSITARLSDNELHSQQIANSKVRLADKTQEASQEYIEALSATKLMYRTYDANGNATEAELTPAIMYQYSDLKNQYGISNTSGQLLVNSTDAANFEASNSVNDFVQLYGVELTDNPQFIYALQSIYGNDYAKFYDLDAEKPLVDFGGLNVPGWIGQPNSGMSQQDYESWAGQISAIQVSGKESGSYGSLIAKLTDVPPYPGDEPQEPPAVDMPDFAALAAAYNNSACHSSVSGSSDAGIWHMEHNLCHLIWGPNGFGVDEDGNRTTITNSDGTISITPTGTLTNNSLTTGFAGSGKDAATGLLAALKQDDLADYECVQELIQSLIDLYCDVVNYLSKNKYSINSSAFSINSSENAKSGSALYTSWEQFYTDLAGLEQKGQDEFNEKYQKQWEEYEQNHKIWEETWQGIYSWQNSCNDLYDAYMDDLANLPVSKIPDEDDPKTSWYVNLWHRMNGESDRKSVEGEKGTYYKQLDDNLLTSQEWLQFALEHGVVTLEKVQFVDEAEDETGLKTTKWMATTYSSCSDITSTEDAVAIARAEAEYNKKLNEIEAKDKKYDNDIKKLDTEHSALQTEYESVKSVIEKNTERSFKAFS